MNFKLTVTVYCLWPLWWTYSCLHLRSKHQNNSGTYRGSHLSTLFLSTAAEPTNESNAVMQCNYIYHCYRDTSCLSKTETTFNTFLWLQASTIASLSCSCFWRRLLASSCFTHDLTWRSRQLVHTGDDSYGRGVLISSFVVVPGTLFCWVYI